MGEELRARDSIRQFLQDDQRISQRWSSLLEAGRQGGQPSFTQLAAHMDADIAANYERSFERLEAVTPRGAAPSAATLEALQAYAAQRAEAARSFAAGLRSGQAEALDWAAPAPFEPPASNH